MSVVIYLKHIYSSPKRNRKIDQFIFVVKNTCLYSTMEDKSKKYEGKNSVIEFVEGWDMIQTLGEGAFGE